MSAWLFIKNTLKGAKSWMASEGGTCSGNGRKIGRSMVSQQIIPNRETPIAPYSLGSAFVCPFRREKWGNYSSERANNAHRSSLEKPAAGHFTFVYRASLALLINARKLRRFSGRHITCRSTLFLPICSLFLIARINRYYCYIAKLYIWER